MRSKQIFDYSVSFIMIVLLIPVYILIAVMVYFDLGHPVLFTQTRPGYKTRPFRLIKFRTMRSEYDSDGKELPDSARISAFGKWLRATSLDELPELWNVLRGEMSLVGPRPLLMEYLPLFNEQQNRRHDVLPGITGWAQVSGRNALDWETKFEKDCWYVENNSFLLDIKILFLTVFMVFSRKGISAEGHVTMEKFKGNNL